VLANADNDWYYQTVDSALTREGDVMRVLDMLGWEIGVRGVFSD
jgi:glycerophosphoryl diester phosphodiesterase